MKLLIITGYSGAGKSVALKAFEDYGLACMDNLPLAAIASVTESLDGQREQLAICSDVRSPDFTTPRFLEVLATLRERYDVQLLFLTAQREVLISRFNATKHRHPLSDENGVPASLQREMQLLTPLHEAADAVIDTSHYSPHSLKQHLLGMLGLEQRRLLVMLQSFSYQRGIPEHADMVFDVRFLRNPHYVPELQQATGMNEAVGAYIAADPNCAPYISRMTDLMTFLLPLYIEEGKTYLTLAIGCTGGQHRSVYVAETLAQRFNMPGIRTTLLHHALSS